MLEFNKQDIIELNKSLNDDLSGWWYKEHLLNSCFSSYYYYESELEQICSIFRGLAKIMHSLMPIKERRPLYW